MKIKYKILGTILVGILIIPQVVFASWWNPFSWNIWKIFKLEPKIEQIQIEKTNQATSGVKEMNTTSEIKSKEEKSIKNENEKDEQAETINKLKNEIDVLKKQVNLIPQQSTKVQNKKEESKNNVVNLPNGSVVEMDMNGNVIRIIKEAPQQIYTTSQTQILQETPQTQLIAEPVVSQPIDASAPRIWEAQFGEQIRTHIPELNTWAPKMIRLVTNEPIDVIKTKFRFRSPSITKNLVATFNVITKNIPRGPSDTCYINCNQVGYYSTFFLDELLSAKVPKGADIPDSYDFEFLVVDMADNYSAQWHSARDISEFVFE